MKTATAFDDNGNPQGNSASQDIGGQFIRNRQYKAAADLRGSQKRSAVVEVQFNRANHFLRTTGDPATTVGLTSIDKQPSIVLLGVQPPRVAELFSSVPTSGTTVRFIRENTLTNAAAATAENGQYPEATWDLVEMDALVKKIAVIGRVTDEFFQDYDATRDYINNRLAYMIAIKEDNALLNANGSANQITGILQTAGILTQAQGSMTVPDAVLAAMTQIRTTSFFEPTGIIMNPNDWFNLRSMKDKNGQYLGLGPLGNTYGQATTYTPQILWNLPVVLTTSIAQGTILVGAFKQAGQIFRRLGLTIETTNSDASDFQYGRIAVRAETRLTLAVIRPVAFCQITGLS